MCVPGDMNWNYYGNKTEGWMPQDLVDLAEKARFVAWKRHGNENSHKDINKNCKVFNKKSKNQKILVLVTEATM